MSNSSLPGVTIGISAYNEAENVAYLLSSILKQKASYYRLERIIVKCDGCTDMTAAKVHKIADKYQGLIVVYDEAQRRGKKTRLEEIFRLSTSDFTFIFDGDIILYKKDVLDQMVKSFQDHNTVLVSANNQPLPSRGIQAKLITMWDEIWYSIRRSYNNAENIFNVRSCAMGIRTSFAKTVHLPPGVISDAQYLYLLTKERKFRFKFAEKAIVVYRTPSTLKEFLKQVNRGSNDKSILTSIFGEKINTEYHLPKVYKLKTLINLFIKDPIISPLVAVFFSLLKFYPFKKTQSSELWEIATSTKRAIRPKIR